jgi:GxxExxY protein
MPDEPRDPRTFAILGAAFEVHKQLGNGFLEAVYQQALVREMTARDIPYRAQAELPIRYKGEVLQVSYRADFICFDSVVVELKALTRLGDVEAAQVLNYLKATGHTTGLLLNFGAPRLEYRRLSLSLSPASASSADR